MAIYEGAGIHGTEETYSLGSAASHGCVRMAIPDVEELYDRVEVGTPIYIGCNRRIGVRSRRSRRMRRRDEPGRMHRFCELGNGARRLRP